MYEHRSPGLVGGGPSVPATHGGVVGLQVASDAQQGLQEEGMP